MTTSAPPMPPRRPGTGRPDRASDPSSLDTTQTSCTHPADAPWIHEFRHMVADELAELWPRRAARIRECGESAVLMCCTACGSLHLFPVRCASRTCPECARRGAAAMAERLLERIQVHNLIMEAEPWDGPGEPHAWSGSDPQGRAWKLVTLTCPAVADEEARFDPDALRAAVKRVRKAVMAWWRSTPWGRQVREPGSREKRVRHDTSLVCAIEIAPGGMVHAHVFVYGEFVPQEELALALGRALGLDGPAILDIRAVDREDPTHGIREALKYATKAEGTRQEQATRAAAVEYAFRHVHRVGIAGALRKIRGRSTTPDCEDVQGDDLHDEAEAACEACGAIGEWAWGRILSHTAVAANAGWGVMVSPGGRAPP